MHALPDRASGEKSVWRIAGEDYEVAKHRVNACTVAALGLRDEFAGIRKRGDLVEGEDPTDEDIADAMKRFPISNCNLDHYPKCNCNRCQIYCPLGGWQAAFGNTGLSAGPKAKA